MKGELAGDVTESKSRKEALVFPIILWCVCLSVFQNKKCIELTLTITCLGFLAGKIQKYGGKCYIPTFQKFEEI